jgi:transcriptional regulator with XRE-family HTH domain
MTICNERKEFAERLQSALRQARQTADSPTALAREFNSRFPGQAITVHAARKWLMAESIPTQDKLRTLAQWLQVSAEWLRFGGQISVAGEESLTPKDDTLEAMLSAMSREDLKLVEALHALQPDERRLVRELIQLFFRTQERSLQDTAPA